MKPQIPWLRVFVEGVVCVGSILLAFGTLGLEASKSAVQRAIVAQESAHTKLAASSLSPRPV